ncbi:uncharacterized protein LOC100176072 [Ciona intestinalis]
MDENKGLFQIKAEARVKKLETLQKNEATLLPRKFRLITKQSAIPAFLGAVVWTVAGYYAYSAWKNSEETEEFIVRPVEEKPVNEKPPTRIPIWTPLSMKERGYKYFGDGNSLSDARKLSKTQDMVVSVNEEYERIEVMKLSKYGWYVWSYPFDVVERDKDGNFLYSDDGNPILVPTILENIGISIREKFKRFF